MRACRFFGSERICGSQEWRFTTVHVRLRTSELEGRKKLRGDSHVSSDSKDVTVAEGDERRDREFSRKSLGTWEMTMINIRLRILEFEWRR